MKLPVTHLTLYKHGVGFFERRAQLSGERVELSFRVEEMNDVLKSLTAVDHGPGQVLGVDYATPQSQEERLAGCSIRLDDDRSLRDLLVHLRGRQVRLFLDQDEETSGTLVGLDEATEEQALGTSLVSLLSEDTGDGTEARVTVVGLERVRGVEIMDERGANDLRFFLRTTLTQEHHRQVTIRLTPGEHDLSVSYVAPAPTWRVSYRLVADPEAKEGEPRALLLGWGVFDNRLEEDLEDISLSLVAGMPLSFVYDLYTPFTPERPIVKEEARVAPGPVEFEEAADLMAGAEPEAPTTGAALEMALRAVAPALASSGASTREISRESLEKALAMTARGEALGELFQYVIGNPVSVGRGQSAMVPIISADLGYRKDLLYNKAKMPTHPVATLRLKNETGLTLERGPVTVLESGEYVGEAILPFTATGGQIIVPYAVELGARIREESGSSRELHALHIKDACFVIEEWDIRWREYQLNNRNVEALAVLVEHTRTSKYELFDTPEPREQTDEHLRFEVEVPGRSEVKLRVQERRLKRRKEEVHKQSHEGLRRFLEKRLIDRRTHDLVAELLRLWERVAENERHLAHNEQERQQVYQAQAHIQGNMGALSTTGKEGQLRARYVEQLAGTEETLKALAQKDTELQAENVRLVNQIKTQLEALE